MQNSNDIQYVKLSKDTTNVNIDSNIVFFKNPSIRKFNTLKIYGRAKIIIIENAYLTGSAKRTIKQLRDNNDSDAEYDFYDNNYGFDFSDVDGLEIIVDMQDSMRHKHHTKVASHKYNNNVIFIADKDGDSLFDFLEELVVGEIETSLTNDEINFIYDKYH